MALLDMPNRWIDVTEVAYIANLTSRQVSSLINNRGSDLVLKRRTECLQYRINGTEEEIELIRQNVKKGTIRCSRTHTSYRRR